MFWQLARLSSGDSVVILSVHICWPSEKGQGGYVEWHDKEVSAGTTLCANSLLRFQNVRASTKTKDKMKRKHKLIFSENYCLEACSSQLAYV